MRKIRIANYSLISLKILDILGCLFVAIGLILNALGGYTLLYYGNARDKVIGISIIITGLLYLAESILLFVPSDIDIRTFSIFVFFITIGLSILTLILWPESYLILIIGLLVNIIFILFKDQILFPK